MYPLERLRKEGREPKGEGPGEKGNGRSKRWEQFPGKNWLPGYAPWGLPLTASFVHLCFGVIEQRDGSNKWLPQAKRLRSRKMSFCSDGVSLKHKNLSIITKKMNHLLLLSWMGACSPDAKAWFHDFSASFEHILPIWFYSLCLRGSFSQIFVSLI